jgi:hypothetical protein
VLAAALSVCVAGLGVACNKGPARAALAETDQALALARPELERYAPAELSRITADAEAARGLLAAGQYTDALRVAQKLPQRIVQASAQANARKSELTPAWSGLAGSLPASIEALQERIDELDASRWPRGFDAAAIDAVRSELSRVEASWAQAESAFGAGDIREAVRIGASARANTSALAARIASPQASARRSVPVAPRSSAPGSLAPRSVPAAAAAAAPSAEPPSAAPAGDVQPTAPAGDSQPTAPPATTVPSPGTDGP